MTATKTGNVVLERIRKTGESHLFSENMHTA
jgi:hypothetical protein